MASIKFSHKYNKMPEIINLEPTFLLNVFKIQDTDLSFPFLEYDTSYFDNDGNPKHYKLGNSSVWIVLLLKTGKYLWTTVRSNNPSKEQYYRSLVGEQINIIIDNQNL